MSKTVFNLFCVLLLTPIVASATLDEQAKLQQGAKVFMNYCSGCHSLRYFRYKKWAVQLHRISLSPTDAKAWFGMVPPDLSLIAREKGARWIYTYLKSFYPDNSRPFGVNNLLVPDVAMPNVMESLSNQVGQAQFENLLVELVTFLVYVGEPTKLQRYHLGVIVMVFLFIFIVVTYPLKNMYWKKEKLSSGHEKL